jgi:excisionase family DNA binding protein
MAGDVVALRGSVRLEPWVNKAQVASYLGRSRRWVELMAREGMPSRMIGGRRAYRRSEVDAWVAERFS